MPRTPIELVNTMTAHERDAAEHRERYSYLSVERSERTGGHLWTERVVETVQGKVRLLLAEDGKPISPERIAAEHARLADIVARPDEFARREQASKGDELRARDMLGKLPGGFLLENIRLDGGAWHVDYRPDTSYSPSGIEDRILHSMSGTFVIDAGSMRLIHIDGRLKEEVSIGMGLVNVHAGSNFALDKKEVEGAWRAVHSTTDIRGRAVLFKTINKASDFNRSDFHHVDGNLTLAQAVAMVQR